MPLDWSKRFIDDVAGIAKSAYNTAEEYFPSSAGTAAGNDLAQSDYDFRYTVFPNDLGMDTNGHYMVININVPTKGVKSDGLSLGTPAGNYTQYFTPLNQVSKLDVLRYGMSSSTSQRPINVPRNTRRIAESIALHMPQGLVFSHQNIYEDISLTSLGGKLGIGSSREVRNDSSRLPLGDMINSLFDPNGNVQTAARVMQTPINPAVEILFANTAQRQFTFDLLLAPRNEEESRAIRKIVQTLRFHAAPEINTARWGLTWIPPADFDITFFHRGHENLKINRINTCVLQRIDVDYNPTGVYSTFRNGYPVAVRLGLGFVELEVCHKQRILQGF